MRFEKYCTARLRLLECVSHLRSGELSTARWSAQRPRRAPAVRSAWLTAAARGVASALLRPRPRPRSRASRRWTCSRSCSWCAQGCASRGAGQGSALGRELKLKHLDFWKRSDTYGRAEECFPIFRRDVCFPGLPRSRLKFLAEIAASGNCSAYAQGSGAVVSITALPISDSSAPGAAQSGCQRPRCAIGDPARPTTSQEL